MSEQTTATPVEQTPATQPAKSNWKRYALYGLGATVAVAAVVVAFHYFRNGGEVPTPEGE